MPGVNFTTSTNLLADKAISHAESMINKYLSKRYDLTSATFQTSTSTPPLIRDLCEQISEGVMWTRLARGRKETLERGFGLISGAKGCLASIQKYEMDLYDTTGAIIVDKSTTAYQVLANTDEYSETFNEDDPLNWVVDPDKLDDISNERD